MLMGAIKGRFQTANDVWKRRKIQIANTSNELVGMDFADYGDFAMFLQFQGDFSSLQTIILPGPKRKKNKRPKWFGEGDFKFAGGVWGAGNYRCG